MTPTSSMSVRHEEVAANGARLALAIHHRHALAEMVFHLGQQRQRVVIVDKAHGLTGPERFQRAENGGVTKAPANGAGVKGVGLIVLKVVAGRVHEWQSPVAEFKKIGRASCRERGER